MSNLGFKISDKFRAAVMLGASVFNESSYGGFVQYAYNTSRVIPYNADGSWFFMIILREL
ncbi:MAG: hypothetical protein ACLUDU_04150 [Butyricimonas faecihominis]